jgi:N4-gp56 family major capsid protein
MVKRVVRGEVGELEGVRFVETTEVPWCSVTNVKMSSHGGGRYYFSFLFGRGAYGVTELEGGVKVIVKNPGPQDTSNPLNLYSTVGYRIIAAAKILNKSCCLWMLHGKPSEVG